MKRYFQKNNREAGVAILLTVMIVAGISVITTTVAFFVVQEIRLNRSSELTEPAIIAAETASEQGIYRIKKSSFTTMCTSSSGGYTTVNSLTHTRACLKYDAADFVIYPDASEPFTIYLYDPQNVQNNTCMEVFATCPAIGSGGAGSGDQLFTSLNIQHISGGIVSVVLETLDGGWSTSRTITASSGTEMISIARDILGAEDERLVATITTSSGEASIRVTTSGQYTGLPDYQILDAEGCVSSGVTLSTTLRCDTDGEVYTRRINVTMPR